VYQLKKIILFFITNVTCEIQS